MPYDTHFVNNVVSQGWVARHLKRIGEEKLSVCPECGFGDFLHTGGCSIAAQMEPHREGLMREGRFSPPAHA